MSTKWALNLTSRILLVATVASVSLMFTMPSADAGTIAPLSTLASTSTASPNNDDYSGTFANNGNKMNFDSNAVPVRSGTIANLEGVFAVMDSNGTSEYALTIRGAYNSERDPPLFSGYRLELGFGKGSSFVAASTVFPDLDFDFPLPASPTPPSSISLFGIFPLFDLQSHSANTITWTGHPFEGSFFSPTLFQLPLDVPDLPPSVMSHYFPGDLPADFPSNARAFTIRGQFVPEPSTAFIGLLAAACMAFGTARRVVYSAKLTAIRRTMTAFLTTRRANASP
jgi:hypothetical protein